MFFPESGYPCNPVRSRRANEARRSSPLVLIAAAVAFVIFAGGASKGNANGTYRVELDNAFGLVTGAEFKVAGVPRGRSRRSTWIRSRCTPW